MARQPFFGRGAGPQIARMDMNAATAPGRAYGQAFANMGKQIGGMIEQYGLNKEKRQKEEDTAMGNLANFSPEDLLALKTSNPKLGQALERATTEQATPRDFQLINSASAPFIAAKARERDARLQEATIKGKEFENKFNLANEENRLLRSTLETEGVGLLNRLRESQLAVADIEKQLKDNRLGVDKELLKTELEQAKASLARTQEEVTQKRNTNSVFSDLHQIELNKFATNIAEAQSALAINAEKLDQLRASRGLDLKTKKANLDILEAERNKLQQDLKNQQNLMQSFSSDVSDDGLNFIQPIKIDDAFQGGPLFGKDAAGLFYNIAGGIGSAFGADITPETTGQAQNLLMLETFLLPALASDISSRPSNFTLEVARQKIPLPSDRDDVGQRKIEQLIPDLKLRLDEAEKTLMSGQTDKSYFQEARLQASRIRKIIPILENSLKEKNATLSGGKTSTNVKFKIRGQR